MNFADHEDRCRTAKRHKPLPRWSAVECNKWGQACGLRLAQALLTFSVRTDFRSASSDTTMARLPACGPQESGRTATNKLRVIHRTADHQLAVRKAPGMVGRLRFAARGPMSSMITMVTNTYGGQAHWFSRSIVHVPALADWSMMLRIIQLVGKTFCGRHTMRAH